MKQINVAILAMSVAASLGLAVGVMRHETADNKERVSADEPASSETRASLQAQKPSYVLGESNGKVAVYLYGKDDPEIVFNVYLHHLPDVDRFKLERGIEIADYDTLLTLIEDYTS